MSTPKGAAPQLPRGRAAAPGQFDEYLAVFGRPRVAYTFIILAALVVGIPVALATLSVNAVIFQLSMFLLWVSFFHLLEFLWNFIFKPQEASFDSFLINQNWPDYQRAMTVAIVEFLVEAYFFPSIKYSYVSRFVSYVGLFMVIGGQFVRTVGMITAGVSFAHKVAERREETHTLVRSGIYSIVRHPAYVGWFYWSVGLQVMLNNPFCSIAFAFVSWRFFNDRIPYEEAHLCEMFGADYTAYARNVPVGIPGIRGNPYLLGPPVPRMKRQVSLQSDKVA